MAVYILAALLVIQDILHRCERKDLYNRIMSKDYKEYKTADKPLPKHISAHRRVIQKWRKKPIEGGEG